MAYALITGAAKGIGRAIAIELAKKKYNLILVDIDADGLFKTSEYIEKQIGVEVDLLQVDLSEPDAVDRIFNFTKSYHDRLNVVVNNAGYGLNGAFDSYQLSDHLTNIDVNIKALVKISYAYLPVLKKFPKGYLLNVGSTTSYQTVPYLNVYASTKAFVLSFTRGLRYELRNTSVNVSVLSPGATDTDFVKRANMGESVLKVARKFNMTAESVGKIAVEGLFNEKAEIIPGFSNKLNAYLPKFFPKRFVEKIATNIYQPK